MVIRAVNGVNKYFLLIIFFSHDIVFIRFCGLYNSSGFMACIIYPGFVTCIIRLAYGASPRSIYPNLSIELYVQTIYRFFIILLLNLPVLYSIMLPVRTVRISNLSFSWFFSFVMSHLQFLLVHNFLIKLLSLYFYILT